MQKQKVKLKLITVCHTANMPPDTDAQSGQKKKNIFISTHVMPINMQCAVSRQLGKNRRAT